MTKALHAPRISRLKATQRFGHWGRCPVCGSINLRYRKRTDSFRCVRCGRIDITPRGLTETDRDIIRELSKGVGNHA